MARPLEVGAIWARREPSTGKIIARYRIRSVSGRDAVCDILNDAGRTTGLRVMLPDTWLVRYESGPLPQLDMPIKEEPDAEA